MKQFFALLIIMVLTIETRAQNSVPLSVYAASGGAGTWGANTVNWTLGECITITGQNSNATAGFGFNQGYALTVGVVEAPYAGTLKVYPNPASETLIIELAQEQIATNGAVYNIAGQLLHTVVLMPGSNAFNCSYLPAGNYILKLYTNRNSNSTSILFQKVKTN